MAVVVKKMLANAGNERDVGLTPGSGRSPGVGNGNPLQYSCLKNSMDRGASQATSKGGMNIQWRTVSSISTGNTGQPHVKG